MLNNPLKYSDPSGYTYRAQAVTFKGRENPDGSYGNWGSFDGGGGSVFQKMGVIHEAGPTSEIIDAWFDSGYNAAGVPLDKFMNLISEDGLPREYSMYTFYKQDGEWIQSHHMFDYEVPTVKVANFRGDEKWWNKKVLGVPGIEKLSPEELKDLEIPTYLIAADFILSLFNPVPGDEFKSLRHIKNLKKIRIGISKTLSNTNSLNHIFKSKHNLNPIVKIAGSEANAIRRFYLSLGKTPLPKSGSFENIVEIYGYNVTIRGAVVDGVPRIGTVFIP